MDTDKDFIDLLFEEMEYSEIILYSFIMVCIIWFFTKVKVDDSKTIYPYETKWLRSWVLDDDHFLL